MESPEFHEKLDKILIEDEGKRKRPRRQPHEDTG